MEENETSDTLRLVLGGVQHAVAAVRNAGVAAQERKVSDERIGCNLECKSGERLIVARLALIGLAVELLALDRRNVNRRRQILDNCIEHCLNALVVECGSAGNGDNLAGNGLLSEGSLDLLLSELLAAEELLHESVVALCGNLNELAAPLLCLLLQVCGDILVLEGNALILVAPDNGLHLDEVYDALEGILSSYRDLQGNRMAVEALLDLLNNAEEVRSGTIHLVDERDAGNVVLVGLAPYSLGLRLNSADRAVNHYGAVEHTH